MRRAGTAVDPRRECRRVAVELSLIACGGGLLFLLIGAWASASATFEFGIELASALIWARFAAQRFLSGRLV